MFGLLSDLILQANPPTVQLGIVVQILGITSLNAVLVDSLSITSNDGISLLLLLNYTASIGDSTAVLSDFFIGPELTNSTTLTVNALIGENVVTANPLVIPISVAPGTVFVSVDPGTFAGGTVLNISVTASGTSTVTNVNIYDQNNSLLNSILVNPPAIINDETLLITSFTVPSTFALNSFLNIKAIYNSGIES